MENGFIIKTSRINNRNFAAKHSQNKSGSGYKSKKGKAAYTKTARNSWKKDLSW